MTPEQFMANFGAIAGAPKGIPRLRELVLALAVRGRLSTAQVEDRPVGELLTGPTGKNREKSAGSEGSKYPTEFDLPCGWRWVSLENIAHYIQRGKGPTYTDASSALVISQKCIQWSGFDISRARFIDESTLGSYNEERFLRPGDLLWNSTGTGTVGRINVFPDVTKQHARIVADSHVTVVRLTNADPRYVWCWLAGRDVQSTIEDVSSGSTNQIELATGTVKNCPVPLPPLAEQKRIVAKVDQLMCMLDDLEQRQEKKRTAAIHVSKASLDSLVDAEDPDQLARAWERVSKNFGVVAGAEGSTEVIRQIVRGLAVCGALGTSDSSDASVSEVLDAARVAHNEAVRRAETKDVKPGPMPSRSIPTGWAWSCLGQLLVFGPRNGLSPKPVNYETNTLSLSLGATTRGVFDASKTKHVDVEIPDDSFLWLRSGDILVQRGNTIEYVGVSALFDGESGRYIYPDLMMKIRVAESLNPAFVHLAMSERTARDYLRARASGTSGSMPKINQSALLSLPLAIPPLAEQKRIVAKVDSILALVVELDEGSTRLRQAASNLAAAADRGI
ncbi:restriction endonuclease subunit S [Nannocystaceae bacterium ST9]